MIYEITPKIDNKRARLVDFNVCSLSNKSKKPDAILAENTKSLLAVDLRIMNVLSFSISKNLNAVECPVDVESLKTTHLESFSSVGQEFSYWKLLEFSYSVRPRSSWKLIGQEYNKHDSSNVKNTRRRNSCHIQAAIHAVIYVYILAAYY